MDLGEIKRALMTVYATDAFNAFDQFIARQLRQSKTVDGFLVDLHRLARLVEEPLPECWMTCTFVSRLPQCVRQFLQASSRMETMTLEKLLTQARIVITDNQGQEELIFAAAQVSRSNIKASPQSDPRIV